MWEHLRREMAHLMTHNSAPLDPRVIIAYMRFIEEKEGKTNG